MQFRFLASLCISTAILFLSHVAHAQLVVDSSLSNATIAVGAVSDTTTTSGNLNLQVSPGTNPFSTAQITDLDLTLDDGLSLGFGLASLNTDPASVFIELLSAGPAGNIVGGVFDQQGNVLAVSGQANLIDPFEIVGGSMSIDLATLDTTSVDFNNVLISEAGGIVTVDASYMITGVTNGFDVSINGRVVASGQATRSTRTYDRWNHRHPKLCLAFLRRRRA